MNELSEIELSDSFEKYIKSDKNKINSFDFVFREVSCIQGIPDFIAISNDSYLKTITKELDLSSVTVESSAVILSLLKSKAPRTIKYLENKSGYQISTVRRALNLLESQELVLKNDRNQYFLGCKWIEPVTEVWAFELKLKNWKRALFQALQYKTFANRVAVVFPVNMKELLNKNIDVFKKFNVGVIIYDHKTYEIEFLSKPSKLKPSSRSQNLYTLSRLASELKFFDKSVL